MLLLQEKLIKIESKPDNKGVLQHRLIFKSQKYDRGLDEIVPCSLPVKMDLEHHHLIEMYKSYVGRVIAVPVSLSSMDSNIYYKTLGDGKPLILKDISGESGAISTTKP